MSFYVTMSMRYIGRLIEPYIHLFSDLKSDLRRSGIRLSVEEYLSVSLMTCLIVFLIELPLFAFIFSFIKMGPIFSIFMAITLSISLCVLLFFLSINYPKTIIKEKSKEIEQTLPFAGIYLSTIASSGLPPHKIFEIFSKFNEYGEISKESKNIVNDMTAFGLNINESLEKSIKRTPSKEFRELLWAILSTIKSGGDIAKLLSQKSQNFLNNYRRKLEEFSRNLTIYLEVYLTALILGSIFFTILTSVMSGIGGVGQTNIILIQFFLIFLFIPLISLGFIVLIKTSSPGEG